jgi:CPA1 family monovalent cation:H+ antiporter
MMTETFQILILLLAVISVVALVAKRLKIPPAILLVITGVGLALIPDLPTLQLAPDLVLVLVLPPIAREVAQILELIPAAPGAEIGQN